MSVGVGDEFRPVDQRHGYPAFPDPSNWYHHWEPPTTKRLPNLALHQPENCRAMSA